MIDLKAQFDRDRLHEFASYITDMSEHIGFKVSSRGWGYLMETKGLIDKSQLDRVEGLINRCRKEGILPVDFVAEESARSFEGIDKPDIRTHSEHLKYWLKRIKELPYWYEPDWWEGEGYYIQMLVEKVDLVTLFKPICEDHHIPIGNSKGWSSILQRADYARRFAEAEKMGLECVLLYCGDHDPDGLRISDMLRKNLKDVASIRWEDDTDGYDPEHLIIDRFGLNYDFIIENNLTWIDNLMTGRKRDLANPKHRNHYQPYLQKYFKEIGIRKCEANAIVAEPDSGRDLCLETIERYLGHGAADRFERKKQRSVNSIQELMDEHEITETIEDAIELL